MAASGCCTETARGAADVITCVHRGLRYEYITLERVLQLLCQTSGTGVGMASPQLTSMVRHRPYVVNGVRPADRKLQAEALRHAIQPHAQAGAVSN